MLSVVNRMLLQASLLPYRRHLWLGGLEQDWSEIHLESAQRIKEKDPKWRNYWIAKSEGDETTKVGRGAGEGGGEVKSQIIYEQNIILKWFLFVDGSGCVLDIQME